MADTKLAEIRDHLSKLQHPSAFLATVDAAGAPQVRPVTLMFCQDKFYLATGTSSRKARQIKNNPQVELVTILPEGDVSGYIRVMGKAERITDTTLMKTVTSSCAYPVEQYWKGVDDPEFFFLAIIPERVEYMKPGRYVAKEVTDEFI